MSTNTINEQVVRARGEFTSAGLLQFLVKRGLLRIEAVEGGFDIWPAIPWVAIDEDDPGTLPSKAGDYLVTVASPVGREVHVLSFTAYGKWLHAGDFISGYTELFLPIAWAPRPDAFDGEVL